MLLGSVNPFSSRKGLGFPGLRAMSTPKRTTMTPKGCLRLSTSPRCSNSCHGMYSHASYESPAPLLIETYLVPFVASVAAPVATPDQQIERRFNGLQSSPMAAPRRSTATTCWMARSPELRSYFWFGQVDPLVFLAVRAHPFEDLPKFRKALRLALFVGNC